MDKKKVCSLASIVLGVVAIVMLFLPAIVVGDTEITYSGFSAIFGYTATEETFLGDVSTKVLNFSFMNFVTFLLVVAAVVCSVLAFVKGNKVMSFAAIACFVVAAVLFFFMPAFASVYSALDGALADAAIEAVKETYQLGAGAIIAAVCSLLAAGVAVASLFLKK